MKRNDSNLFLPLLGSAGLLSVAIALSGCGTLPSSQKEAVARTSETPAAAEPYFFFDGRTGDRLDWPALVARLATADIVLVGEQHDNVAGHRLEAAIADAFLRQTPRAAVALEMFERHEQGFVDAYLDGGIAATTLMTLTESENWGGGKNTWMDWYQPIVDQVKRRHDSGAALIAANAPRAYAKLARLEGFSALDGLPLAERTLFQIPDPGVDDRAYRDRFFATMRQHSAPDSSPKAQTKAPAPKSPVPATAGKAEDFFRAQQVWDATMADSVLRAYRRHPKVLLFVGEYHVGFSGGTQARIRHGAPAARIEIVSILRSDKPESFGPSDKDRADIVVYTPQRSSS